MIVAARIPSSGTRSFRNFYTVLAYKHLYLILCVPNVSVKGTLIMTATE